MSKNRDIADILGKTENVNTNNAAIRSITDNVGLEVYATLDDLPTTELTSGDQAFITSTNRVYVSNGSGWYNVALINATPRLSISPSGTITLAVDGSTPTVITLTGTDSDNADANLVYSVESDGSFANIATISQDSSVFTITPLAEDSATPGSSTLTFKVSDGISFGSGTTEFSLTFGPDWSATPTETIVRSTDVEAGDKFGISLSISKDNNYLIVGAGDDDGAGNSNVVSGCAYIFTRSGSSWTQQAILRHSDAAVADRLGEFDVDINNDGTYAIATATAKDSYTGAVYVFARSGSTWTQQAKLTAEGNAATSSFFGYEASINGDGSYVIVGQHLANSSAGNVYIFARSGSTWTRQLRQVGSVSNARLGASVAMSESGTYAAAGEILSGTGGQVFVFTRSGSTWTMSSAIVPSDIGSADQFGVSVAIEDDYLVVGSRNDDDDGSASGSAYVFTRSGSTWTQQAKLTASDAQAGDQFGESVGLSQDTNYIVVGAPDEDGGAGDPATWAGAAYVFERDGSTWTQLQKLTASDAQTDDKFGEEVQIGGDGSFVIAGAFQEDGGSGDPTSSSGTVYVYEAG
jgi:hypothetical protein